MKRELFNVLRPGAKVRHRHAGDAMLVTNTYGDGMNRRLMAVRVVEVTNPDEWDLVDDFGSVIG